jgi:predicted DCC family thiol-disulfide oxidoreductase YuxK
MPISVFTEITDNPPAALSHPVSDPRRGWILYDGDCAFCRSIVSRIYGVFAPRGFALLPLQTPWVRAVFHLPDEKLLSEMRVLTRSGEKFGGADAIPVLARYVWWAWPLVVFTHLPGANHLLRAAYRFVASRRHCISGTCSVRPPSPAPNRK